MKRIKETLRRYDMLPKGTSVLCAVSGGADSVSLLHWLKTHERELDITVRAAHYEHGLRGAESVRDMEFVQKLCSELDVPLTVGRGDVAAYAAEHSLGTEEAARDLRYAFLIKTAEETGCGKIATAHNACDNAETVLLNLARGSGTAGLCGIPPVRDSIIRPLIEVTREEIEAYLEANGLDHIEDSSNASDIYSRNRIRHDVMPVLRSINPALEAAVTRSSELLRADSEYLDSEASRFIAEHYDGSSVPLKKLAALPEPVEARVIRALCPKPLSYVHTADIIKLSRGTELAWLDVPGVRIRRQRGRMYFTDPPVKTRHEPKNNPNRGQK